MQTLAEAAAHIAQEIERTRQHLVDLEQALSGLQPLITIEAATTTVSYTTASTSQVVEDASIVNAKAPRKKEAAKSKPAAKTGTKSVAEPAAKSKAIEQSLFPATGADFWLRCAGSNEFNIGELTKAALQNLDLDETAKNVIANRARAWITSALKKGVVLMTGKRDDINSYKLAE